ncbi:hypothetical protein EYF80_034780 [Liparis tanakae]|uniref:Uncharacterized protein n=1 Tax=Liparis tanakae TaxID=230148 RepID=A0A4Z2GQE6_9TELE|nr:hypothetical protein EYF80_034780 [Liparis tanakae]
MSSDIPAKPARRQDGRVPLTDSVLHPLGFVLPPHADEVDGDPRRDDAEADGALHRGLPDGDDDEEEAGEHEAHRQQNIHLNRDGGRLVSVLRRSDHVLEAVETGRELEVARIYRVTGERRPVTQRDELRSHIIPTIAKAMQSQLKKLKKLMTEKMSLEKA